MQVTVDQIYDMDQALTAAASKAEEINKREAVFGWEPTEYDMLDKMRNDAKPYFKLWMMASDFVTKRNLWLTGPFLKLDGPAMEKDINTWWTQSFQLKRSLERKILVRPFRMPDPEPGALIEGGPFFLNGGMQAPKPS